MNINLPHTERWHQLNEAIHKLLGLSAEVTVRTYSGIHHAAFEVVCGTASFYSHKKSVAWRKGQTYSFATPIPWLYKEGFQVQILPQKNPINEISGWVEALKKDTTLVMMNDDHPITHENFDNDLLDQQLDEKKIFSMRCSHARHWLSGFQNVRPSSVLICEVDCDLAFAICGSRFKSPVQIASHLVFDELQCLEKIEQMLKPNGIEFVVPSQLPNGFEIYSSSGPIMVYHPEVNGQALVHLLCQEQPILSGHIQALNSCAQGFTDWDWWEGRPTAQQIRGMIVIDRNVAKEIFLNGSLTKALQSCQIV